MAEAKWFKRIELREQDWLAEGTDIYDLLEHLRGKVSDRKLRLFALACCQRPYYQAMADERYRRALRLAERMADSQLDPAEWKEVRQAGHELWQETWQASMFAQQKAPRGTPEVERLIDADIVTAMGWVILEDAWEAAYEVTGVEWDAAYADEPRQQVALLRDIFGNPFRPPPRIDPAWLACNADPVLRLAQAAYERALPAGILDPERLAELADALERAGCPDREILGHLRGPGPHVRGCHILDLLLKKE